MSVFEHDCDQVFREEMERVAPGLDYTVTNLPPLVAGPYTSSGMTCPHGITYWCEPTGEQIAKWAREGVR